MTKRLTNILLLCLLSLFAWTQNANEDFDRMNDYLNAPDNVTIEQEIKFYPNFTTTQSKETQHTIIKRKGTWFYSKANNIERIENKKYALSVDHYLKHIDVGENPTATEKINLGFDTETLLEFAEKIIYKKLGETKAQYTLHMPFGKYEKLVFQFNPKSYKMHKIIAFHKQPFEWSEEHEAEKPRLEHKFVKIDRQTVISDAIFSEKRFLANSGKNLKPLKKYSEYQFTNHINLLSEGNSTKIEYGTQ